MISVKPFLQPNHTIVPGKLITGPTGDWIDTYLDKTRGVFTVKFRTGYLLAGAHVEEVAKQEQFINRATIVVNRLKNQGQQKLDLASQVQDGAFRNLENASRKSIST